MAQVDTFIMMAKYNARINRQLLTCCSELPPEKLHENTGSFFSSVMAHWNHIMFGDLILLKRLVATNALAIELNELSSFPEPKSPTDMYFPCLSEFAKKRACLDQLIIDFCNILSNEDCTRTFSYTTTEGDLVTKTVSDVLQHVFNHQTHHRGQLTCILSQMGQNYGCMDLPVIVPEGSAGF